MSTVLARTPQPPGPGAGRTRRLVTASLFTALLAASAWVAVPVGSVPLTLQTFVLVLAALLLGPLDAAAAVGCYLLLGAVGVPVFAGLRGGAGVLLGPTGGYLQGFLLGAVLGALVRGPFARRGAVWPLADLVAATVLLATVYLCGAAWLVASTGIGPRTALVTGVLPFLPLDAAKAAVAIGVATALRRARVAG